MSAEVGTALKAPSQVFGAKDSAVPVKLTLMGLRPLSRNWWWNTLGGNELEVEGAGFLFKQFNTM